MDTLIGTPLAANLQWLRKRRKRSQDVVAAAVGVKRSTYSCWGLAHAEPRSEHLVRLAAYYRISLDRLLRTELHKLPEHVAGQVERGRDERVLKDFLDVQLP